MKQQQWPRFGARSGGVGGGAGRSPETSRRGEKWSERKRFASQIDRLNSAPCLAVSCGEDRGSYQKRCQAVWVPLSDSTTRHHHLNFNDLIVDVLDVVVFVPIGIFPTPTEAKSRTDLLLRFIYQFIGHESWQ